MNAITKERNVRISEFNIQDINNYFKYPIDIKKLNIDILGNNKPILNDLITKKLKQIIQPTSKRWLKYNTYFGTSQIFKYNPKLQIRIHQLKRKYQNKVLLMNTYLLKKNQIPFHFLQNESLLKNRLSLLDLIKQIRLDLINLKYHPYLKHLSLKEKYFIYLGEINENKTFLKEWILPEYLPFLLQKDVLSYRQYGYDQLKPSNKNIFKNIDVFEHLEYPKLINQYLSAQDNDSLNNLNKFNSDNLFTNNILDLNYQLKIDSLTYDLIQKYKKTRNERIEEKIQSKKFLSELAKMFKVVISKKKVQPKLRKKKKNF